MSPIDSAALVLHRWSVGNFRLSCTVQKLLDIFACAFNLAAILPLKQTFLNLTSEMTPSPNFSYRTLCLAEMRNLRHQAFWSVSSVSRYTHKRLSWKSPLTSRKLGVRYIDGTPKAHPWPKPRRLMYNIWDSSAWGRLCACWTKHRKKTPPVDNFTHMGNRDPPPIIMNFGLHGDPTDVINCAHFCFDRLGGFCSVRFRKWPFPIRSDHRP